MYTAKSEKLSLITFFLLILSLFLLEVLGVPVTEKSSEKNNIIYTRYVRRRPSEYRHDLYVDDFVEVFSVRQKAPPSYLLSDDEVDRIIRCDFNPELKECDDLTKSSTVRAELITSEATSTWLPTTTLSNERVSSTKTTTTVPLALFTTTQAPIFTTTEELPFLPDIPFSAEETTGSPIDADVEILGHTADSNEFADKNENEDAYVDDYDEDIEDTYVES